MPNRRGGIREIRYSPRNIKVACNHEGLTHVGGIHFFHEFLRVLQLRHFPTTHLTRKDTGESQQSEGTRNAETLF